jgi:hypothetical protein
LARRMADECSWRTVASGATESLKRRPPNPHPAATRPPSPSGRGVSRGPTTCADIRCLLSLRTNARIPFPLRGKVAAQPPDEGFWRAPRPWPDNSDLDPRGADAAHTRRRGESPSSHRSGAKIARQAHRGDYPKLHSFDRAGATRAFQERAGVSLRRQRPARPSGSPRRSHWTVGGALGCANPYTDI